MKEKLNLLSEELRKSIETELRIALDQEKFRQLVFSSWVSVLGGVKA